MMDDQASVPLSLAGGLPVSVDIISAVSFDLSGQADVSLWQQSGRALVETRAAVVLSSSVSVAVDAREVAVEGELRGAAQMDVNTDVKLAGDPVLACVRMAQPDIRITEERWRRVLGGEETVDESEILVPGRTWNLNNKNNQMCKKMRL